jgi:RND family efflux transporter MFP subunit
MKKIVSLVLFLALVVAIVLYAAGAFHGDQVQPGTVAAPPGLPAPTRTVQAELATVPLVEDAVGTVTARTTVQVAAQVQARVKTIHADAGQRVTAGRPLVELDDRDLVARRAEAGEGLAQAEAARESAVQAQARAEAVKEQARKRFDRVASLLAAKAATPEMMEEAEAGFLEAEASVAQAQAAVAAAGARIQQAKQVVEQADVAQGFAQIAVPITGVVSQKSVEEGDLAWPGKTLYEIMDPTDLRLEAQVREGLIARVEDGIEFQIVIPALGRTVAGMVSEVCPVANPQSRTFRVRVEFEPPPGVHAGMYGRMRIPLEDREVVSVPTEAIRRTGQLESVVVQAADGRWTRRIVTTGRAVEGDRVEVLSGLAGGETVGLPERGR